MQELSQLSVSNRLDKPMPLDTFQKFCRLGEATAFVNGDAADTELTHALLPFPIC